MTVTVKHDPQQGRFEVEVGNALALLDYEIRENSILMLHTEVPAEAQGHGIASALAKEALEYARSAGLEVVPLCHFVQVFLRRHPSYLDIVSPKYRTRLEKKK